MKVDLQLNLPDLSAPLHIRGAVVRWVGSQGIGIEFPSLPFPDEEQLEGIIRRLEARAEQTVSPSKPLTVCTGSLR